MTTKCLSIPSVVSVQTLIVSSIKASPNKYDPSDQNGDSIQLKVTQAHQDGDSLQLKLTQTHQNGDIIQLKLTQSQT